MVSVVVIDTGCAKNVMFTCETGGDVIHCIDLSCKNYKFLLWLDKSSQQKHRKLIRFALQ